MPPRILTLRDLKPREAERYPDRADDVYVYIPNGRSPLRQRIGPAGAESEALARGVIADWLRRQVGEATGAEPLFADFAARYLDTGVALHQIAGSTARMERYRIKLFMKRWPTQTLSELTHTELLAWWEDHVVRRRRSIETGKRWLSALSSVYRYAGTKGVAVQNPVRAFLPTVARFSRTKVGRAEQDDTANPIETAEELAALERAVHELGDPDVWLLVLLLLDHGLRRGEAFAARPCDMELGEDDDDTRRLVRVRINRPGSQMPEAPKSGRGRGVPMSRRLRAHLRAHYGLFPSEKPLLIRFHAAAQKRARKHKATDGADYFQRTVFAPLVKAAGMPGRVPKDLRDTFASHLLTAGFPQTQIMRWLGHAPGSVAMFRQRYGKWIGEDAAEWSYREPVKLERGEVPSDYLARLTAARARLAR